MDDYSDYVDWYYDPVLTEEQNYQNLIDAGYGDPILTEEQNYQNLIDAGYGDPILTAEQNAANNALLGTGIGGTVNISGTGSGSGTAGTAGTAAGYASALKNFLANNSGLIGAGVGLASLLSGNKPTTGGYSGTIPKYTATRQQIPQADAGRRPGSAGRSYFTDTVFTPAGAAVPQLAKGGIANSNPRYLRGSTDGMADKLDTSIDGHQPAKLSHGEFVVPADVVSHLGNGNSDAGAKKLYSMMDKVRMARTGSKKQGKEINPDKFLPGGKVGYAGGGIVAFATGGTTQATDTTLSSTLSPWAGDYVTNMLGKGQALSEMPYQAYTGP